MLSISKEDAHFLSQLMTPLQYANVTHTVPYCYTLGTDTKLSFIGVHHSNDPADSIFGLIKQTILASKPDLIFVEGVQSLHGPAGVERMVSGFDDETAITRGGEAIFTIKQALDNKIPWTCPEPEDVELYRALIYNYFSKEEIAAWHLLRLLPQYQTRHETSNFVGYMAPFIAQFKAATNWKNFDYSYEAALATASRILGYTVSVHNTERSFELIDPIPWTARWEYQTIFNEMSRVTLRVRDESITQAVLDEVAAGTRVLVVYGSGHAVMQEPVYRLYLRA